MNYFKIFTKIGASGMLALSLAALTAIAQTKPQPAPKAAPAKQAASRATSSKAAHRAKKSAKKKLSSASAKKTTAPAQEKQARQAVRKPAPKKPAKSVSETKAAVVPPVPAAAIHPAELPELTHGRDPFAALIRPSDPSSGHTNLPPGIAGLQVSTVQLQGMVKTSDGMVAVVANPQDRVYFLHDGDHIYDGVVEKIGLDEITFLQQSKDAFGRTVDRDVSKRLYPIAGDEQ